MKNALHPQCSAYTPNIGARHRSAFASWSFRDIRSPWYDIETHAIGAGTDPRASRFRFRKARPKRKAGGLFNFPQNGVLLAPRPSLVPRSDKANRAAPVAPQ